MDTLSTHNCSPENRVDDLLRSEVLQAFDRATFERDGYWVWEGILTDAARKRWTASLQKLQQMNDAILMDTEWNAIDFQARGFPPPLPEQITPEFLAACCGGSEQMPGFLRTAELRRYMHHLRAIRTGSGVGDTWIRVARRYAGILPRRI